MTTPLPQLVKQTRDRLSALVREADPAAAEWVEQVRGARPKVPSVVVVGETNRGKSSLVNALLRRPGLSPVDASVATASYLLFQHAEEWACAACYPGDEELVPLAWDQLTQWEDAVPPRYVQVDAPLDALVNMTIVDTPGVGGLASVHGEVAVEAANAATVLLFVIDASAPLTRGELSFLHKVADRVETVVFALTKTDQHRGWREVLEGNRVLLREHAPRFADVPLHPVSPRLYELGTQTSNAAEMLRERSGIDELRTMLEQLVTGRSAMLGEANTLRALSTVLGELIVGLESEKRALTSGEDEAEKLRERREELTTQRRSSTKGWQVKLRGEIQRARVESSHEVTREVREVQNWFRSAIDTADRAELAQLPQQVDAGLRMLSSRVAAALSTRLSRVTDEALAELFSAEELAVIRSQVARGSRTPIALRPPERRPATSEDKLLVVMGMSGGLGLGRAALLPLAGGALAALNPIVLPVTIAIGLGAGWWMARTRKHAADKQHMKQWLSDAIAEARSTLDQLVSEQHIGAEQQLSLALDDALQKRIDAIDGELREVDSALKMDAAERRNHLHLVNGRLTEAKAGQEKIEQLLGQIRELRDRC